MTRQSPKRLTAVLVATMGLLAMGVINRLAQAPGPSDAPNQFYEPISPAWSSPESVPQRPPRLPKASAPIAGDDWSTLQVGERIEFTLPSSERFIGVVTEERQGRVATSISGNLEAGRRFHFTLTAGPAARFGTINTPLGVYEIATIGDVTWLHPRVALPRDADAVESDVVLSEPSLILEEPPEIAPPPMLGFEQW